MWHPIDGSKWDVGHPIEWREFLRSVELTNYPRRYAYRGQGNSLWRLTPSLYREAGARASPARRKSLEKHFMTERLERFKELYLLRYPGAVDPRLDIYQWAAIAQHQGLATPLLDWTFSPVIAAFFAAWYYDLNGRPSTARIFRMDLIRKPRNVLLLDTKLTRENLRYYAQQGAFACVAGEELFSTFSDCCIDELDRLGTFLSYVDIPISADTRDAVLSELMGLNITIDKMFPDGMSYAIDSINWEFRNH